MESQRRGPTRRAVLAGTASLVALAGCQSGGESAAPVTIGMSDNCEQCGMVISEHPGPVGETYYQENTPTSHEEPVRFCSTTCTYRHRYRKADTGWAPAVTYLTDYSVVDYEIRSENGTPVLTRHLDADAFAESSGLTVVANSDVEGAMGTAIVPFSSRDDAAAFAEEYGGQTLEAEEIPRQLVTRG